MARLRGVKSKIKGNDRKMLRTNRGEGDSIFLFIYLFFFWVGGEIDLCPRKLFTYSKSLEADTKTHPSPT